MLIYATMCQPILSKHTLNPTLSLHILAKSSVKLGSCGHQTLIVQIPPTYFQCTLHETSQRSTEAIQNPEIQPILSLKHCKFVQNFL